MSTTKALNLDELSVPAKWTPDCQGKWDYDGDIITVSTRYWGRGGSFWIVESGKGIVNTGEAPERQHIKPSAHSAIHLNYGDGDYVEIVAAEFEGETETEVKAAVEAWVKTQFHWIVLRLAPELAATPKGDRE